MSETTTLTPTGTENPELLKRRELVKEADQPGILELNGRKFDIVRTRVKKGRGMGNRAYLLKFDEKADDPFVLFKLAVGVENWKYWLNRRIQEEIADAAHDSLNEKGEADEKIFPVKILEAFQRSATTSKVGIRALREKLEEIVSELTVILTKEAQKLPLAEGELLRKGNLLLQMTQVHAQIEKKEVKGKKA